MISSISSVACDWVVYCRPIKHDIHHIHACSFRYKETISREMVYTVMVNITTIRLKFENPHYLKEFTSLFLVNKTF